MAKIHINANDIKGIIKSYASLNNSFMLKSYIGNDTKKICKFNLNGMDCAIDIYIKPKYINFVPKGKNVDHSNLLIDFIANKGHNASIKPEQFSMYCTKESLDQLEQHIKNELAGVITICQTENLYKVTGYNGDIVTIHYYPQKDKILIQGRPYQAYSIILSFFASIPEYDIDDIVNMGTLGKTPSNETEIVRQKMKESLGEVYGYLDDALLKSISGSISMINQLKDAEDYTGCLTGAFKALEGYLKKLLTSQFEYTLTKSNTFSMFYKTKGHNAIDLERSIPEGTKDCLNKLYLMYSSKRNVYLHATINPAFTRIITSKVEAKDLLYDILTLLNKTYVIIFRKEN